MNIGLVVLSETYLSNVRYNTKIRIKRMMMGFLKNERMSVPVNLLYNLPKAQEANKTVTNIEYSNE